MSFIGGRKQNEIESRGKEINEEKIKNSISQFISEIQKKNEIVNSRIDSIRTKNYLVREDEVFFGNVFSDIRLSIEKTQSLFNNDLSALMTKHSSDYDKRDKLTLFKQHMIQRFNKESDEFKRISNRFETFKNELKAQQAAQKAEPGEESGRLIASQDDDQEQEQQYKVSNSKIQHMADMAAYKNEKTQQIYQNTLYLQKISKDINEITVRADTKVESLIDNIDKTKHNSEETIKTLINIYKDQKDFLDNKCCIGFLISLALLALLVVISNMYR